MKNNQFTRSLLRSKRQNPNLAAFFARLRDSLLSCVGFSQSSVPKDVPRGHMAVYAGSNHKRFVIRITHLNNSLFRALLEKAKDEYGFDTNRPLILPCDRDTLQNLIILLCNQKDPSSADFKLGQQYITDRL
ncbi:indole-3-acetic acid-induced protein ARG7-like [Cryptomeria japonica]|uniref:indole-3-acetic acid-induced protein ARG7-like n=1 Tax=Cryptomeria japonica TaxID=3369 RepID=UPI0027DA1E88|nr:indole-3-acetic acid-induced protein ARG7-like [Cryptomeria japonica]